MKSRRICRLSQQQIQLLSDNLVSLNQNCHQSFHGNHDCLTLLIDRRPQNSESLFYTFGRCCTTRRVQLAFINTSLCNENTLKSR